MSRAAKVRDDIRYPPVKQCSRCRETYRVVVGTTFNNKSKQADNLQPHCVRCQTAEKRERRNGWFNFVRHIDAGGTRGLWTRDKYEAVMMSCGDFACYYCGNDVTEWSAGYWIDRIDSDIGYVPSNCVPCCKGCNFYKSDRSPESFLHDLDGILKRYPRGKVPWNKVCGEGVDVVRTASKLPDLSEYVIKRADKQVPLFKVTA